MLSIAFIVAVFMSSYFVISIINLIRAKNGFVSEKKKSFPSSQNQIDELQREIDTYMKLTRCPNSNSGLIKIQEQHIEKLQALDREKEAIELQNFKMVKSIETFNLCCELIAKNPMLLNMLIKSSEVEGVQILRQTLNFNDEEFKANQNSLRRIVVSAKKGLLTA